MSLSGDRAQADDLVQETLVKAWDKFSSFQEGTNLRAWLFTILRNTFLSEKRKRRREVEDSDGKFAETMITRPEQPGHMDLADLRAALAELPEAQRTALMLVVASGLSYEEAAEVCGCAIGTIKSRVNRARARLAELLQVGEEDGVKPAGAGGELTPGGGREPEPVLPARGRQGQT